MSYLRLENLSKSFGKKQVLYDLDLEIEEGTFCVLLGPSGCGKSTLLNCIAGLEKPNRGRIYLQDRDITDLEPHQRDMAMVFQNYALYPHLTVFENMAFGLRARKEPQDEISRKVQAVSRILGIEGKLDCLPRQLSGGERQRVATGRAIVREPLLFLFDEPLSNLDARLRMELRRQFLQLQRRLKKTTVYVTHDQVEALSLGDQIVVFNEGHIQQVAPPAELYREPANLFVAGFIGSPAMNLLRMKIQNRDKRTCLVHGSFTLPAPAWLAEKNLREVILGFRPTALKPAPGKQNAGEAAAAFDGLVRESELLGEEVLYYIEVAENLEIQAVLPANYQFRPGASHSLVLPLEAMYFFDPNGDRIRDTSRC